MTLIPMITHPLGMYWEQPSRNEIAVDDECALMDKAAFKGLQEYSRSIPTGAYEGKMWKRINGENSWLCWYGISDDPGTVSINARPIIIVDQAGR